MISWKATEISEDNINQEVSGRTVSLLSLDTTQDRAEKRKKLMG
jgi:hypothetical protein